MEVPCVDFKQRMKYISYAIRFFKMVFLTSKIDLFHHPFLPRRTQPVVDQPHVQFLLFMC